MTNRSFKVTVKNGKTSERREQLRRITGGEQIAPSHGKTKPTYSFSDTRHLPNAMVGPDFACSGRVGQRAKMAHSVTCAGVVPTLRHRLASSGGTYLVKPCTCDGVRY